ncbi:hypothetical protein ACIBI4_02835 [Streptomyces sp. NPDC050418]|uniref:hypothetical protein n=1 Tax=Streptomyces sp. NPDC050418 TaxID=3365612 RepID=UPI00378DB40B
MDQRIGQNDAPLHTAASMDPGFIPGITPGGRVKEQEDDAKGESPVTGGSDEDETEASAAGVEAEADEAQAEASQDEAADEAGASGEDDADADSEERSEDDSEEDSEEDGPAEKTAAAKTSGEQPTFEAKDHRGGIVMNADGIEFSLDDQATDFTWDEVVAVEQSTARFAKRLTVTVHTKGDRWYPNEVRAPDRGTLTRWTEELDNALDAYFEE